MAKLPFMCGISGYYSPQGIFPPIELERMNALQQHRGPDSSGVFTEGPAGLGHRRLSIIDLSQAANQPMTSACGQFIMVYNGEVYNFRELLQQIRKQDPSFEPRSHADSEVVLQAFALWGLDFLHRLNGMFAIAIYDRRQQALYLFRDRLGVKPLYYYYEGKDLIFSSELKALSGLPTLSSKLETDQQAISSFLLLGYIPAPLSIYRQIRKLPAGAFARIDRNGFHTEKWWEPAARLEPETTDNPRQALQHLESLLESSVSYRLTSDVPYGSFLSGGIDSSLITAIASKLSNEPLNTFTIGSPVARFNEAGFAKQIARHLGTSHHELFLTEKEVIDWLPVFFNTYDEPFADSSGIPSLLLSHFSRHNVTMTLSGDGGDELFMGYGAYRWAERLRSHPPATLRKMASAALMLGNQRMQRASALFRYESHQTLRSHIFSQEQYCFSRTEIRELLRAQPNEIQLNERPDKLPRKLRASEQQALFDLQYYLPDDLLVKVDRATMAASLETRIPLLDYRIVEFALNVHPSLKYRNGKTKWLLRELLAKYIPRELFERPKKGFSIPLDQWLQNELKFLPQQYLSDAAIKKTGVLQPLAVKKLLEDFYLKNKGYLYQRVWLLVVLQRWLLESNVAADGLAYVAGQSGQGNFPGRLEGGPWLK